MQKQNPDQNFDVEVLTPDERLDQLTQKIQRDLKQKQVQAPPSKSSSKQ